MSANLLLDLDDFYRPSGSNKSVAPTQQAPSASAKPAQHTSANQSSSGELLSDLIPNSSATAATVDFDDDFGDFETAAPPAPNPVTQSQLASSVVPTRTPASKPVQKKPRNANVLFDADDDGPSDEDDFGDFEGGTTDAAAAITQPTPPKPSAPSVATSQPNLIDFDAPEPAVPAAKPPSSKTSSGSSTIKKPGLASAQHSLPTRPAAKAQPRPLQRPKQTQPAKAEPAYDDVEWDDFEAEPASAQSLPPSHAPSSAPAPTSKPLNGGGALPFHLDPLLDNSIPSSPQANIPPPTILLSVFPTIAEKTRTQFFDPLSQVAGNSDVLQAAYSHPLVRDYLTTLLTLSTVLARIVAGRKNRWKRDTLLAQSMRISQASAGGRSGGMKLAGLDKSENAREERDVADAVRAWRSILGRLRSAISAAGKIGAITEIKEDYIVRTGTEKEGAVVAPKQCVLCGLKRNERVVKVDVDVQDSFGEWWVEHWGHRDCARFWETYEKTLKGK